jgi:hypothetical protein
MLLGFGRDNCQAITKCLLRETYRDGTSCRYLAVRLRLHCVLGQKHRRQLNVVIHYVIEARGQDSHDSGDGTGRQGVLSSVWDVCQYDERAGR